MNSEYKPLKIVQTQFFVGLFLICLAPKVTYSQYYIPFPEDSAVWYSVRSQPDLFPPYILYHTGMYFLHGDTLLNDISYTKFYSSAPDGSYKKYLGASRVVSDSRRVYFWHKDQSSERLSYDFSLSPGDTIFNGIDLICIDTGEMLLLDSNILKYQTMYVPDANNCYQIWVEGIGSLGIPLLEPLWGCAYTFELAYDLSCFFYKGTHVYEWPNNPYFSGCVGTNVSVPEHDEEEVVKFYPNPCKEYFQLEIESQTEDFLEINIFSSSGIPVQSIERYQIQKGSNSYRVNCSELSPGIYLVNLQSSKYSKTVPFIKLDK